jgi:acyl-coenzyme A thioesterase PaaI-like protein
MTMRSIIVTAAVAAVAASAGPAAAKTTHHYKSVIRNTAVSTANGYPDVGGTAVLAGTWTTDLFGNGALVDHVTITGRPTSTSFAFRGTETTFVAKGSLTDKFTGTATVNPDGTQTIVTKGQFVRGSGAYRGAKGSFTFSGSTANGSSVVVGQSKGTVVY